MASFPPYKTEKAKAVIISTASEFCPYHDTCIMSASTMGAGAWGAADRAVGVPVLLEDTYVVNSIAWMNGAQAGTYDVGIYDEAGNRKFAASETNANATITVGAAGVQVTNVSSLALSKRTLYPGLWYLTLVVSTTTTLTVHRSSLTVLSAVVGAIRATATGSVLPATISVATAETSQIPLISASAQQI